MLGVIQTEDLAVYKSWPVTFQETWVDLKGTEYLNVRYVFLTIVPGLEY